MTKRSVITLPNGTLIEISPDLSPEQITAMITALTSGGIPASTPSKQENSGGRTIIEELTAEEIWASSKKERVALFIRNNIAESLWFTAKDIQDQQLSMTGKLSLGETSAIATYLTRLFEAKYLDRKKGTGRTVSYRITDSLISSYPEIPSIEFNSLISMDL